MNSDISIRTIALSSSNRNSATALVSSVLPTPVGPRNRNEPNGRIFIVQTGPRPAHGIGDGFHGGALPDHALADLLFHAQQLLALTFQHLAGRNRRSSARQPERSALGAPPPRPSGRFRRLPLRPASFPSRDHAVGQLPGLGQIALAFGVFQLGPRRSSCSLQLARPSSLSRSACHWAVTRGAFSCRFAKLLFQLRQPIFRGRVVLFLQRFRLDLLAGYRGPARPVPSGLLSTSIRNGEAASSIRSIALSGREPIGDIAMDSVAADTNALSEIRTPWCSSYFSFMPRRMLIVSFTVGSNNTRLEPARQERRPFRRACVFIQSRRADAVQFTARQRRFDQVRRIHRAVRFAGPDQRVHFVDETG